MKHVAFTSEAVGASIVHAEGEKQKWAVRLLATVALFAATYAEEKHAEDGLSQRRAGVQKAVKALLESMDFGLSAGTISNRTTFANGFLDVEKQVVIQALAAESVDAATETILAHWAGEPAKFKNAGMIQSHYGVKSVTAPTSGPKGGKPQPKAEGEAEAPKSEEPQPTAFEVAAQAVEAAINARTMTPDEARLLAQYLDAFAEHGEQGAADWKRELGDMRLEYARRMEAEAKAEAEAARKPKRQRKAA